MPPGPNAQLADGDAHAHAQPNHLTPIPDLNCEKIAKVAKVAKKNKTKKGNALTIHNETTQTEKGNEPWGT